MIMHAKYRYSTNTTSEDMSQMEVFVTDGRMSLNDPHFRKSAGDNNKRAMSRHKDRVFKWRRQNELRKPSPMMLRFPIMRMTVMNFLNSYTIM